MHGGYKDKNFVDGKQLTARWFHGNKKWWKAGKIYMIFVPRVYLVQRRELLVNKHLNPLRPIRGQQCYLFKRSCVIDQSQRYYQLKVNNRTN